MKVYIPFKQDRAMVFFTKAKGIIYLPEGKRLPGIPKKKRITLPLYTIEDITESFPGLAQEIDEYSIIAGAASEAEEIYEKYQAYLIRKASAVIGIATGRRETWKSDLAQNMINEGIKRVRVFTEGYEENVFVISTVVEHSRPESVRQGGMRVMFIRTTPPEKKAPDFRTLARGWGIYIPPRLLENEAAARCPLAFVQEYREAYLEHKRLESRRREKGDAIRQAYADLKDMAVKTERGFFVMYSVSPAVVSAHQRKHGIRVLFVDPEKKEEEQEEQNQ